MSWLPRLRAYLEGRMVPMFDIFGTEMDFKSETCLSFELEKRCQTTNRNNDQKVKTKKTLI